MMINLETLKTAYYGLIVPRLTYAVPIWGYCQLFSQNTLWCYRP